MCNRFWLRDAILAHSLAAHITVSTFPSRGREPKRKRPDDPPGPRQIGNALAYLQVAIESSAALMPFSENT